MFLINYINDFLLICLGPLCTMMVNKSFWASCLWFSGKSFVRLECLLFPCPARIIMRLTEQHPSPSNITLWPLGAAMYSKITLAIFSCLHISNLTMKTNKFGHSNVKGFHLFEMFFFHFLELIWLIICIFKLPMYSFLPCLSKKRSKKFFRFTVTQLFEYRTNSEIIIRYAKTL